MACVETTKCLILLLMNVYEILSQQVQQLQ